LIAINEKTQEIKAGDILSVGDKFGIKKGKEILKEINEAVRNFKH
jgi:hypothetical protein